MKNRTYCHGFWMTMVLCLSLVLFSSIGCIPKHRKPISLVKLSPRQYPHFSDSMNFDNLSQSIERDMVYFSKIPANRTFTYGRETYSAEYLIKSLQVFDNFIRQKPSNQELNKFIRDHFIVYESCGNDDHEMIFTGYFEPIYQGNLVQDNTNIYPLFSIPDDLLTIDLSRFSDKYRGHKKLVARLEGTEIKPYFSRKAINNMKDFSDRAAPVAWLSNRVDRFFLEIQGSGQIMLPDHSFIHVHYAGSNGNPYNSVGRHLIETGQIPQKDMSMNAIRQWLETHPQRMDEILHLNQSVVFFQAEEGGPYGSLSVELTPFRSIALDQGIFPRGALCFAMTALPDPGNPLPRDSWQPASWFLLHQDTGGAIKGTGRADIFCGNGDFAEFTAGNMNTRGRLFFLILKKNHFSNHPN